MLGEPLGEGPLGGDMALSITQANNPSGCNHYDVNCLDGAEAFTVKWHDVNPAPLTAAEREQLMILLLRYKRSGGAALNAMVGVAL